MNKDNSMMRFPIREVELTGRARVRAGWFGRMVLQVEERVHQFSACPPMPGSDPKAWRDEMRRKGIVYCEWRDATWEDVQAACLMLGLARNCAANSFPQPEPSSRG